MFRTPLLSRVVEILLRIDLDVPTRRIDVRELLALVDHVIVAGQKHASLFDLGLLAST